MASCGWVCFRLLDLPVICLFCWMVFVGVFWLGFVALFRDVTCVSVVRLTLWLWGWCLCFGLLVWFYGDYYVL